MSGPKSLKHIYMGDEGAKFLRGEDATAVCGYLATGKGDPNVVEWCADCREAAGLARKTESW